jgi:signal transduction histidine kinase
MVEKSGWNQKAWGKARRFALQFQVTGNNTMETFIKGLIAQITKRIQILLNTLLNPLARVTNPEKIQRSRLLSAILFVQTLVIALIIALVLHADPRDINEPTVQGAIFLVGISVVLYGVNRFGYTSIPAWGYFLVFVTLFIYIPFYSGENPAFLAFLVIPLIFVAIFFSIKQTTAAALGILILVGVLLSFMDNSPENLPYWNLRNMWYFLMLATGLVLTFMRHLGNMEQIRQRELKRINQDLQQKVAELERFTYIVSHDLRNPLVTIKGFVGMLDKDLKENKRDRIQNDFQRIAGATDKIDALLSDLLEISRIGRLVNPPEQVDTVRLIEDALDSVADRIRSRNVAVNVSSELPILYGDRIRLREVFENLIENAIKYMGDQTDPLIEIGIRDQKHERVMFVKDNGMGIEERYHERIFGLFEKLNPSIEGTGLGLALVKRIIETHGGEIWVESEGLGKGSTFCFTIPDSR